MTAASSGPAEQLQPLIEILGGDLDSELILQAVTHRSYAYENGGLPTNERLEFLGDAVLGVIVTERLYRDYPDRSEGELAKLRAAIVNSRALAEVARQLGVGDYLRLGRGEESSGGRDKSSILADSLEALIATVYLQRGLEPTRRVLLDLFADLIATAEQLGAGLDWKTSLQELASERGIGIPDYVVDNTGPDHQKVFTATVVVGGRSVGQGSGRSKKEAEQRAAERAWRELSEGPTRDA